MNFLSVTAYAAVSDCKLYAVCLAMVNGRFRHSAYYVAAGVEEGRFSLSKLLGVKDSRGEAEELCREHARQQEAA
jgi:hypothetical protein